jgi:signal peptidase I
MNDDRPPAERTVAHAADAPGGANGQTGRDGQAGLPGNVPLRPVVSGESAGPAFRQPPGEPPSRQSGAAASQLPAAPVAQQRKGGRSFWRELPILVLIALIIALLIKSFVVQAFFIPSSSMEDTLDIGDKVLVSKLTYDFRSIEPGDIVVFNGVGSWDPAQSSSSSGSELTRLYNDTVVRLYHSILGLFGTAPGQSDYIKRVIGVPGDRVACCNARGQVTVNGRALNERSYLYPGDAPSLQRFHVTVPPGRLWVMGDHRSVSWDSRGHMNDPGNGTVPESKVVGRAFMIVWPPSRWRILPIPATFDRPGIDSPAAGSATGTAALNLAAIAGARVVPAASYLPLGAGFAGAVPLTWLQLRVRRQLAGRRGQGRPRRG